LRFATSAFRFLALASVAHSRARLRTKYLRMINRQSPQWTDNPLRVKWLENNDRKTWENLCTLWKQIY